MTLTLVDVTEKIPLQTNEHGIIYVAGTRVTLDTVVATFKEGFTAEEIMRQYPSLELSDVYYVIAYYLQHIEMVEDYLHQGEIEHEKVREQNEAKLNPIGIRERLLTRKRQQEQSSI